MPELSDHTAYRYPNASTASAGKICAMLEGVVAILWSVNVKAGSPSFTSVDTPTYAERAGPPPAFSTTLSGATKIWYRLPLLAAQVGLRSTRIVPSVLAVFEAGTPPAAGKV